MREIRGKALLFSCLVVCSFIIGCTVRLADSTAPDGSLADPTGPDGSLVIGRVVINNHQLGTGGNLPVGTVDYGIAVEIASEDGNDFIKVTTGHEGYFLVANIPPNTYYLSKVSFESTGSSGTDTAHVTLPKSHFFIPVPGKMLHVGTYSINISENLRTTIKHPISDPEVAKSFLKETYPSTAWLARQFVVGHTALGERVYFNSNKGYRVVVPPKKEWDVRLGSRLLDVQFRSKGGGGWIGTGALKTHPDRSFADVNAWWIDGISKSRGWRDIDILEEENLTLAGHSAKVVTFEYTNRQDRRRIGRTYHIYRPGGRFELYRIRMSCRKENYEEFLPVLEKLVKSFSFL